MSSRELDYCWAALALAVINDKVIDPDKAVNKIFGMSYSRQSMADDPDTLEMIRLREQGRTYKEIAEITGYNPAACWARINRGR